MYNSLGSWRWTRGLAVTSVLLGVLVATLFATASGAFAQDSTTSNGPERVYALTTDDRLLSFDGDEPQNAQSSTITGLEPDESLIGIDFRPTDSNLYGVGDQGNIYLIEESTFSTGEVLATVVSTLTEELTGTSFGVDFNPRNDQLRIVSDRGRNLAHDLATNTTDRQNRLDYAAGDPNAGDEPKVTALAYTNNLPVGITGTTLYDIDTGIDVLTIQQEPPTGTLVTEGNLGVNAKPITGFDIVTTVGETVTNRAFAAIQPKGKTSSSFYEVALDGPTGGQVTKIGRIGDRGTIVEGLAIPIGQQ